MHETLKENVLETMETDLIIFDLDGTLIDSSEDIALAANRVLADLGHTKMDSGKVKEGIVIIAVPIPGIREAIIVTPPQRTGLGMLKRAKPTPIKMP